MSLRSIVSASVYKLAELRTAKNSNSFATLTLREKVNGKTRWWQAIVFDERVIEDLRRLEAGESLAVAGVVDAEVYAPAGSEPRINWRITIDAVLTARKPKRQRDPGKQEPTGEDVARRSWAAPSGEGRYARP